MLHDVTDGQQYGTFETRWKKWPNFYTFFSKIQFTFPASYAKHSQQSQITSDSLTKNILTRDGKKNKIWLTFFQSVISFSFLKRKMPFPWDLATGFMIHIDPGFLLNSSTNMWYSDWNWEQIYRTLIKVNWHGYNMVRLSPVISGSFLNTNKPFPCDLATVFMIHTDPGFLLNSSTNMWYSDWNWENI